MYLILVKIESDSNTLQKVSLPGEVVRRVTPAKVACRLGCGGPGGCRHEQQNFTKNGFASIFNSISANWVLADELIAMARPSEPFLDTLLPEMREAGVKSLVNVQELGEHGHCGQILKVRINHVLAILKHF